MFDAFAGSITPPGKDGLGRGEGRTRGTAGQAKGDMVLKPDTGINNWGRGRPRLSLKQQKSAYGPALIRVQRSSIKVCIDREIFKFQNNLKKMRHAAPVKNGYTRSLPREQSKG